MADRKVDVVKFTVEAVNPKTGGILGTDKVWYNLSKFVTTLNPGQFSVGHTYEVEVQKGKQGSLYIQKVVSEVKPIGTEQAKTGQINIDRNREIGERGFIQAAVVAASNLNVGGTVETLEVALNDVLKLMDKVLKERTK